MSKKTSGMGSVRQRPNGSWEGRYTAPDGVQRSVYAKTQKECVQKLRAAQQDAQSADWRKPRRIRLSAWMAEWLDSNAPRWSANTRRVYGEACRQYILPALGAVQLTDLTPAHLRRMMGNMTRSGLSDATVRLALTVLHGALAAAVEDRVIARNVASGVRRPRLKAGQNMHIVDRDLFAAFAAAAREIPCGPALVFDLLTGLRAGELRGLRWQDVDLDKGMLRVRFQYADHARGFVPPKDSSRRDVYLPEEAVALLRRQKSANAEKRLASGAAWRDLDLVFCAPDGGPLSAYTLSKAVHTVGARIGVPELHPHDLRHSYAVAALRAGTDVKTVQHNLGHATAAMTLDVYAAYTADAGQEAARRLAAYWQENVN